MLGSTGRVIFEALVSTFSARKSNHVHGKAHNAPPSACFGPSIGSLRRKFGPIAEQRGNYTWHFPLLSGHE